MSYDGKALKPGSTTLASQVDTSSQGGARQTDAEGLSGALGPQTVAEATPAPAVQMRSGDARHDSHAFSAAPGEPMPATPRPTLEELFGVREQAINDDPALPRGIDTDDQGNVSGASERWAEFDASAASGDRTAMYAEIDRRYYAAAGTNQKIKPGEEGNATAALRGSTRTSAYSTFTNVGLPEVVWVI